MNRAKLSELCTVITDGSHNPPKGIEISEYMMLSSKNVHDDYITYEDPRYLSIEDYAQENKRTHIATGDILLTIVGTVGRCAVVPENCGYIVLQRSVAVLKPRNDICHSRYLMYALMSKRAFFESEARGVAQKGIYLKQLSKIEFQVPSLKEQNDVICILDEVKTIVDKRKQQLAKLDELVKARFVEMFGDLETNSKGYEKRKLGSLANKISDGVHAKPEYTETGRPFISVVNINKGVINFEECKFVSEDAYQKMIKSTHPERGDVLYTKVGATYGIPAYVDTDTEFCLYVSVCLIKPKHDEIDARFLALSMSMPYIKRQADSRIKGIGVPDLHLNQIREFDVICPPRDEQEAFVTFVEQTDKSKLSVQQSIDQLETLKKSLMQKYFG